MSQTKAQLIDPVDGTIVNADINASAAIAKSKLAALDIVNADVNASAAIAGTKISPDFGSQNIVTTGTLGANNTTITGSGTNALEINGTGSHELYSYHDSGGVGWATGTGGSYGELLYLDESGSTVRLYSGGTERFKVSGSEVVVNDPGGSVDFRVEGDTNTNLLFADASADKIGIGHSSPAKLLDVKGGDGATTEQYLRNNTVNLLSKIVTTTEAQFGTETSHPLVFLTGNTERIRVATNGNVTMPHQAVATVGDAVNVTPSNDTPLQFNSTDVDKGGMSISNSRSRITVPTAGTYLCMGMVAGDVTTASVGDGVEFFLLRNGSVFPRAESFPVQSFGTASGEEYAFTFNIIVNLSASDYLEICLTNIGSSGGDITRGNFSVSLIS